MCTTYRRMKSSCGRALVHFRVNSTIVSSSGKSGCCSRNRTTFVHCSLVPDRSSVHRAAAPQISLHGILAKRPPALLSVIHLVIGRLLGIAASANSMRSRWKYLSHYPIRLRQPVSSNGIKLKGKLLNVRPDLAVWL